MKIIVTLFLFATLLFSNNPHVYSAIGDKIYDTVDNIEKLLDLDEFTYQRTKIKNYVDSVRETKKLGFLVESGDRVEEASVYLKKIRVLSSTYESLQKEIVVKLKGAIVSKENNLFSKIINSEVLNLKSDVIVEVAKYYKSNSIEIEKSKAIELILKEYELINKKLKAKNITQKQLENSRLKRIKERDKRRREEMLKSLEEEVKEKKKNIIINQKIELETN